MRSAQVESAPQTKGWMARLAAWWLGYCCRRTPYGLVDKLIYHAVRADYAYHTEGVGAGAAAKARRAKGVWG